MINDIINNKHKCIIKNPNIETLLCLKTTKLIESFNGRLEVIEDDSPKTNSDILELLKT